MYVQDCESAINGVNAVNRQVYHLSVFWFVRRAYSLPAWRINGSFVTAVLCCREDASTRVGCCCCCVVDCNSCVWSHLSVLTGFVSASLTTTGDRQPYKMHQNVNVKISEIPLTKQTKFVLTNYSWFISWNQFVPRSLFTRSLRCDSEPSKPPRYTQRHCGMPLWFAYKVYWTLCFATRTKCILTSMTCEWCNVLIAAWADSLSANVTNAQPDGHRTVKLTL